jgi:hypothetical protein
MTTKKESVSLQETPPTSIPQPDSKILSPLESASRGLENLSTPKEWWDNFQAQVAKDKAEKEYAASPEGKQAAHEKWLAERERSTQAYYRLERETEEAARLLMQPYEAERLQEIERKQEEQRLRQEQEEAEHATNLEKWEGNQRRRRQLDINLPDLGNLNIAVLCHEGEDYAHEFYTQFFSLEYMGYFSVYSEHKKGYMLPLHPVYKNLLFSVTGSVWDLTEGWKKGPPIPEINFILLYGHFVCGYELNKFDHLSPHQYRRAIYGYASWLGNEKVKRTKGPQPREDHWDELFTVLTLGMFMDNEEDTFKDRPRSVYKRIVAFHKEDVHHFEELKDEDSFVAFLHACCEGGEYHGMCSYYFEVKDVGRVGVKKFQFTLNPDCIPSTEEEVEKKLEEARAAIPAALRNRVSKGKLAPIR